jgi:hypothetical protein
MIKVFSGKVRKTGFFQKAGFPGNSDRIFGICYISVEGMLHRVPARRGRPNLAQERKADDKTL